MSLRGPVPTSTQLWGSWRGRWAPPPALPSLASAVGCEQCGVLYPEDGRPTSPVGTTGASPEDIIILIIILSLTSVIDLIKKTTKMSKRHQTKVKFDLTVFFALTCGTSLMLLKSRFSNSNLQKITSDHIKTRAGTTWQVCEAHRRLNVQGLFFLLIRIPISCHHDIS